MLGFVQFCMVIGGLFALNRWLLIKRRIANEFAGVDPERFELWKKAYRKSVIAFFLATWGGTALSIGIGSYLAAQRQSPEVVATAYFATFLIPLVPAAVLGSKAARLRKDAGIHLSQALKRKRTQLKTADDANKNLK